MLAFFLAEDNILAVDGSFIFILILFIILVYLINRIVFKPVLKTLAERDRLTTGTSGEAAAVTANINQRVAKYEDAIRQARSESYRQLEERRTAALGERAKALELTKSEIATQIDSAKADLHRQVEQTKTSLATDAQAIAAQITSTILKRTVGGLSR